MPMLSFRISEDLWARVNAACGEDRSAWARGVIEQALAPAASAPGPHEDARVAAFRRADALRRAQKSPAGR